MIGTTLLCITILETSGAVTLRVHIPRQYEVVEIQLLSQFKLFRGRLWKWAKCARSKYPITKLFSFLVWYILRKGLGDKM